MENKTGWWNFKNAVIVVLAVLLCAQTYFMYQINKELSRKETIFDDYLSGWKQADIPDKGGGLLHWNPLLEMKDIQERMNRLFGNAMTRMGEKDEGPMDLSFVPDIDLEERKDCYIAKIDIPGVNETSIKVKVEGLNLVISGERLEIFEKTDKLSKTFHQERRIGSFSRTFRLPEEVNEKRIATKYESGVLIISVPKLKKH